AYAIIGQGTISRIIESRPEDLRLFLEEAAGVSKYKERRRETEGRMADTREHLTRVDDILREMLDQLAKLESQAEVATRFQSLQSDLTTRQQQQWFLKRAEAQADGAKTAAEAERVKTELEAQTSALRRVEAALETTRQAHYAAADAMTDARGQLYESSAEVGRLEAEIRHVADNRRRIDQRLTALAAQIAQWAERGEHAGTELGTLDATAADSAMLAEQLAAQVAQHDDALPASQQAVQDARQQAGRARAQLNEWQQQLGVLAAEARHVDEQQRQVQQRQARLQADRQALMLPDESRLADLTAALETASVQAEDADRRVLALQQAVPELEQQRRTCQQTASAESARRVELSARLDALAALQAKLRTSEKLKPWLARHRLDQAAPLWSRIEVDPGWENALEAALRERLGALELPADAASPIGYVVDPPPTRLALLFGPTDVDALATRTPHAIPAGCRPLAERLRSVAPAQLQAPLANWLEGCYGCESLEAAWAARAGLRAGESIFVAAGHAVGTHGVSFYASDSESAGLLARAQEIEQLRLRLQVQTQLAEVAQGALARVELASREAADRLATARREATELRSQAHRLQLDAQRLAQQAEQARTRSQQLDAELAEIADRAQVLQQRHTTVQAQLSDRAAQRESAQREQADFDLAVQAAERALSDARDAQREREQAASEADFALRSLRARHDELLRAVDSARLQHEALSGERQGVEAERQTFDDSACQAALQNALTLKVDREALLSTVREAHDVLGTELRAGEAQRMSLQFALEPLRARISELQLKEQAAQLGVEQWSELLREAQADLDGLAQSIVANRVRLPGMQGEIDRLQRAIDALGLVNLAALAELAQQREREQFLQAQASDLREALGTLEAAIRKIDAETRELLANTFKSVNEHFSQLFPELFGGGQASLQMTGEEILDCGVQVIAQPPGKRNQSIQLLSGGEKALTAIALVFAIFLLNPAPFCLLDEVDAPLDDANTERYAKLVTRMSRATQFLFISHNRIAMEMAEQLIGVTMQEPGVSRVVAVDMESAASLLAEAA
ncbi:MAG: chromosome segregation protein SMC, partial [Burkholderiales bacterium]